MLVLQIQRNVQIRVNSGSLSYFISDKNSRIIQAINGNRSENLNLHDPKNVYIDWNYQKQFGDKYREFNEISVRLLRKVFGLFPINNDADWKLKDKIVGELKGVLQKLDAFKNEVSRNFKDDEVLRHNAPINYLMTSLSRSILKLEGK